MTYYSEILSSSSCATRGASCRSRCLPWQRQSRRSAHRLTALLYTYSLFITRCPFSSHLTTVCTSSPCCQQVRVRIYNPRFMTAATARDSAFATSMAGTTSAATGGTAVHDTRAASAAASAFTAAFKRLACLHCRLLFRHAAPLFLERPLRRPSPAPPPPPLTLPDSLPASPSSLPAAPLALPPPPSHRRSRRTSIMPRLVRLRPERNEGRTQSMPRMAAHLSVEVAPSLLSPLVSSWLLSQRETAAPAFDFTRRMRGRGSDALRPSRGVDAA